MTSRRLINRFLRSLPIKKKHEARLHALYRSGAILVIDGKGFRKVSKKEVTAAAKDARP